VSKMLEGEKEKLLRMEEALAKRVRRPEEALRIVANAIRRSRAGLADPRRPNGSFLFLDRRASARPSCARRWPIPVRHRGGDDPHRHVGVLEKHSVARLIGAPPGYVGYEEGGYITEAVRRRPYSSSCSMKWRGTPGRVQRAAAGAGRRASHRRPGAHGRLPQHRHYHDLELGSQIIQEYAGEKNYTKMKSAVMEAVQQSFRPEFINRIDDIVSSIRSAHARSARSSTSSSSTAQAPG